MIIQREGEKMDMWDIVTPILYATFLLNLFYAFRSYKKESIPHFLLSILIHFGIGFLSLWSVGMLLFICGGIQILILWILIVKKKTSAKKVGDVE
ncbi:hypothetical protein [Parageobacillus thermoglucosidasius]|uniref:Uncharacterized protein n=2 Tax=Parageobacillus thermoglucosidasius TaxID=1426 RepID=A0AB38R4J9_PARTM|nr:hypothetical protein [Parageobacillus thermoglucosidasius]UOE78345.1 hypothetical protein IMI45_19710 [Parageobacillus thermoglucosidasius]